jgi:porphobilinogen deaminase
LDPGRTRKFLPGGLRRQAQWWSKISKHTVFDLRGNVNTGMQKLNDSGGDGAVFAAAGWKD